MKLQELPTTRRLRFQDITLLGKKYRLKYAPSDIFIAPGSTLAYCDELAENFLPLFLDPRGCGSLPSPPEFTAYRLIHDLENRRLCVLYEVYWKRQDCTWREFNKDHDHDYEQLQIHFDLGTASVDKVVLSSVGPPECAGHGVEVYGNFANARSRIVHYSTSPKKFFPWGGNVGQNNFTQIREIPLQQLEIVDGKPVVIIINCYHVFTGLKKRQQAELDKKLKPKIVRLDRGLLMKWYYRNAANRFGHDVSKPFEEPFIMYYPPPEDWLSRLVYGLLWLVSFLM
jgi:hypothetical protein